MRSIVTKPTVKGDLSGALNARLPEPYQRYCRPCDAIHLYEQPFRLSALRGGLELQPNTSPPVLQRIPGWRGMAADLEASLDPVRATLRLLGPATPKQVAAYLDAPVKDVRAHWPEDVEQVTVDGESRDILTADAKALSSAQMSPAWSGCSGRSTFSCRVAIASSSYPKSLTARTSGAPSDVPAQCWWATRSSAPGDREPRARSCASRSTLGVRSPT